MIASGSLDGTAKLWDIRRTDNCCETIAGHTDEVTEFDIILHIFYINKKKKTKT